MALTAPENISVATPADGDPFYSLNNWSAGADPTVNDDEDDGYNFGSFWFRVTYPYGFWVCTDPAATAAVWKDLSVERNRDFVTATAGENLAAQDLVNLYNDAGTLKARKANATTNAKPCDGFIPISATSGDSVVIMLSSAIVRTGLSGLTVAADLYLSTTGGASTATAPSSSGNIVQRIGKALSTTTALFERGVTVEIA